MNPNWTNTFRHMLVLGQFRATPQAQQDYRDIISKLIEEGGSFAVTNGHLYLSEFSLAVVKDWIKYPADSI